MGMYKEEGTELWEGEAGKRFILFDNKLPLSMIVQTYNRQNSE